MKKTMLFLLVCATSTSLAMDKKISKQTKTKKGLELITECEIDPFAKILKLKVKVKNPTLVYMMELYPQVFDRITEMNKANKIKNYNQKLCEFEQFPPYLFLDRKQIESSVPIKKVETLFATELDKCSNSEANDTIKIIKNFHLKLLAFNDDNNKKFKKMLLEALTKKMENIHLAFHNKLRFLPDTKLDLKCAECLKKYKTIKKVERFCGNEVGIPLINRYLKTLKQKIDTLEQEKSVTKRNNVIAKFLLNPLSKETYQEQLISPEETTLINKILEFK